MYFDGPTTRQLIEAIIGVAETDNDLKTKIKKYISDNDKNKSHLGWSNRDTWKVNLWLTNDPVAYAESRDCKNEIELKDCWLDLFEPDHDSVDLDKVNFKEVFEAISA
jgi:hypothetical protein